MQKQLANAQTTVEASKTVAEIQGILQAHRAKSILTNYDKDGFIESLSFSIETPTGLVGFRLPVNPESVLKVMLRGGVRRGLATREQAIRVSWRIVRDWVRAQMALLETEMVKMEQVFLPYMIVGSQTLFEVMQTNRFQLKAGNPDEVTGEWEVKHQP